MGLYLDMAPIFMSIVLDVFVLVSSGILTESMQRGCDRPQLSKGEHMEEVDIEEFPESNSVTSTSAQLDQQFGTEH